MSAAAIEGAFRVLAADPRHAAPRPIADPLRDALRRAPTPKLTPRRPTPPWSRPSATPGNPQEPADAPRPDQLSRPPGAAYEGMAADQNSATILSRTVETPEGIGFGRAAFQGSRDDGIAASGAVFRGIVLADRNARPNPTGTDLFAKGETAPVMNSGAVWVVTASAASAGSPAYVTPAGAITAAASGNTAIANALFDTSAPAGGLVRLRLN